MSTPSVYFPAVSVHSRKLQALSSHLCRLAANACGRWTCFCASIWMAFFLWLCQKTNMPNQKRTNSLDIFICFSFSEDNDKIKFCSSGDFFLLRLQELKKKLRQICPRLCLHSKAWTHVSIGKLCGVGYTAPIRSPGVHITFSMNWVQPVLFWLDQSATF